MVLLPPLPRNEGLEYGRNVVMLPENEMDEYRSNLEYGVECSSVESTLQVGDLMLCSCGVNYQTK